MSAPLGIDAAALAVSGAGTVWANHCGLEAIAARTGPAPEAAAGDEVKSLATAFKRGTQQRYIDRAAENGLKALHDAARGMPEIEPARKGLLIATALGPATTRDQYLRSYSERGGRSPSATLFSNCGYNIVGAMLARSLNLRGPVLTFGATPGWAGALAATARRMFAAGRADLLFVGRAEAEGAVILALRPATHPPGLPLQLDDDEALWQLARQHLSPPHGRADP